MRSVATRPKLQPVFRSGLLFAMAVAGWIAPALASTSLRITKQAQASNAPSVAWGPQSRLSVAWSDTRDGNAEIYYCAVDPWGNRLTPDMRITNTGSTSTAPRLGVDAQGFVYLCWAEGGNVSVAKLDWQGNIVVPPKTVAIGSYVVFMNPDIAVPANGGCAIGLGARTGALDDLWVVNFDGGLNQLCNTNSLYHNATGVGGPAVSMRAGSGLGSTLTFYREGVFDGTALASAGVSAGCSRQSLADICSGSSFPTINTHGHGVVFERSSHVWMTSGAGCGAQLSENPGPSTAPSAAALSASGSIAVWVDRRSGNNDLYFATYTSAIVKSGADTALVTGPSSSVAPSVTSDAQGTAFVAWQDDRDGNTEVYFTRIPEPANRGTIVGTVYDGVTGLPVPFAHIDIVYPDRPALRSGTIIAGSDGTYRLAGLLQTGPWALSASSAGFVSPQVTGVQVAPGQTVTVDLRLATGRVLAGTVRDAFNKLPVGRAVVRVDSAAGLLTKTVETGPDGRYRFDLRSGAYRLLVSVPALGQPGPFLSLDNPYYQPDSDLAVIIGATDVNRPFPLQSNTVVLVHGIRSQADYWGRVVDDPSAPDTMRTFLEKQKWHTEAVSYDWKRTIEEGGGVLHRWLGSSVFKSSHVVAHSMGGLVTRWCAERIADPAGERPFSQIVTLGTLHHGTPLASNLVELVKELVGWPLAQTDIPGIDLLSDLAVDAAIRKWIPFVDDFKPGSVRLNRLNHGTGHDDDPDGSDVCIPLAPAPTHPSETLLPYVRYDAFAGDAPQTYCFWALFMNGCPSDGAVPVHSAHLYNHATNVKSYTVSCFADDPQCRVRHLIEDVQVPCTPSAATVVEFRNSTCVQARVKDALQGLTLSCASTTPLATGVAGADSMLQSLPHAEHLLAPGGSASDVVHVPAGARFVVVANARQDGVALALVSPTGSLVDSAACAGVPGRLFLSDPPALIARIELSAAEGGDWTVNTTSLADSSQVISIKPFVGSDVTLDAGATPAITEPGAPVAITAELNRAGIGVIGASVLATIEGSQGEHASVTLHDDGVAPDAVTSDGIYTGSYTPPSAAAWAVRVAASGGSGAEYGGREATTGFQSAAGVLVDVPDANIDSPALWTYPSDELPFTFSVRNTGSGNADSVWVIVHDDTSGVTLVDTTISVSAGTSVNLGARFHGSQLGAHWVRFGAYSLQGASVVVPALPQVGRGVEVVPFGGSPVLLSIPRPSPPPATRTLLTTVGPNPSRDRVEFGFQLPEAARDVSILIVDAAGRRIANIRLGPLQAGWHRVPWRRASPVAEWASGVLFYRVQADALAGSGRIVTLR